MRNWRLSLPIVVWLPILVALVAGVAAGLIMIPLHPTLVPRMLVLLWVVTATRQAVKEKLERK